MNNDIHLYLVNNIIQIIEYNYTIWKHISIISSMKLYDISKEKEKLI